jgi:putative ABC transport system permease protein
MRSRSRPGDLLPSVKSAISDVDPDIGVLSAATMTEMLAHELARPRFNTTLLNLLAAIALVLAITGLYGVMSTYVSQRTPEIGIRMALGADTSNVLRQVVGQGMRLALAGGAIGLGAALVGTRMLSSLLFGVTPADPLTLASATLLLMLAALGASYLPARRATRVDPMVALRYE